MKGQYFLKLLTGVVAAFMLLLSSCDDDNKVTRDPDDFPSEGEELTIPMDKKPIMVWVDASANFSRFVKKESIDQYLQLIKESGITHVIVDVRLTAGYVMYPNSQYATELVTWKGVTRDKSWDYLGYFIEKCRSLDLSIYAAMNTFTSGQNQMGVGMAYDNAQIGELTSILHNPTGMTDMRQEAGGTVFMNAADPRAQEYVLNIIKEVVGRYDIDGIVLDRCRFDSEEADFSNVSKKAFEKYLQKTISFPSDIYSWKDGKKVYGPYRKQWYEWRAGIIHDFFAEARKAVKQIKPDVKFATYTGGWYPTYYREGANWASKYYNASANFPEWATFNYKSTGYAEELDYHLPGLYYNQLTGSGWWTVEGGITNVKQVTRGAVPVVAGLAVENYYNNPNQLAEAVELCLKNAHGVMLFDFWHIAEKNLWSKVNQGVCNALGKEPVTSGVTLTKIEQTIGTKKIAGYSAVIDFAKNPKLKFNVVMPASVTVPSETVKTLPAKNGTPILAVNGGYFYGNASNSLVVSGGVQLAPNIQSMTRSGKTVYPVRSVMGLMEDGHFDFTWVYNVAGSKKAYSFPSALDNDEQSGTFMASAPTASTPGAKEWNSLEAVGGGPRLLENGNNVATYNYWREAFDGGGIAGTSNQPRTAMGVTSDGKLILIVIDGRRPGYSDGCTLAELADLLKSMGAVDALNLDGGGSSVMVGYNSKLLTRPCENDAQRKVSSCVVISEL